MTRKHSEHIHTWDDGRGLRDVLLDGRVVEFVTFADTRKGKVVVFVHPFRPDKYRKRALTKTLYGEVEVRFREDE